MSTKRTAFVTDSFPRSTRDALTPPELVSLAATSWRGQVGDRILAVDQPAAKDARLVNPWVVRRQSARVAPVAVQRPLFGNTCCAKGVEDCRRRLQRGRDDHKLCLVLRTSYCRRRVDGRPASRRTPTRLRRRNSRWIVARRPEQRPADGDEEPTDRDQYPGPEAAETHAGHHRTVRGRGINVVDHGRRLGFKRPTWDEPPVGDRRREYFHGGVDDRNPLQRRSFGDHRER